MRFIVRDSIREQAHELYPTAMYNRYADSAQCRMHADASKVPYSDKVKLAYGAIQAVLKHKSFPTKCRGEMKLDVDLKTLITYCKERKIW